MSPLRPWITAAAALLIPSHSAVWRPAGAFGASPTMVAPGAARSAVALPLGAATVVGSGVNGARSVMAGDVDGDGDLDAVAASQDDGRVRWFENTAGNATAWTAHQIAARNAASWAVVADVDGDGDLDVVASSWGDDRIAWHENTAGNARDVRRIGVRRIRVKPVHERREDDPTKDKQAGEQGDANDHRFEDPKVDAVWVDQEYPAGHQRAVAETETSPRPGDRQPAAQPEINGGNQHPDHGSEGQQVECIGAHLADDEPICGENALGPFVRQEDQAHYDPRTEAHHEEARYYAGCERATHRSRPAHQSVGG